MEAWIHSLLSSEQVRVLENRSRSVALLASAGSGKTRTLAAAIASELATGVPAQGIVAFTFTEKAAEELRARVHTLVRTHLPEVDPSEMFVGTIHAWCFQYLRDHGQFTNYKPLDELHLEVLVSRLYDELDLSSVYGKAYPRGIDRFLTDLEVFYNEDLAFEDVPPDLRVPLERFLSILANNRLLTFGDMIRRAIRLLKEHGPLSSLRSLYVDEYQDVNPAQVNLIRAMLPAHGQLLVVGDDLQCIYQWRGSDVNRILRFAEEFDDASIQRLTENYRSRPDIVRLANRVAESIHNRDSHKTMVPIRSESSNSNVLWLSVESDEDQVQAVVEIVRRFGEHGTPWSSIAILLRSVVSYGMPFVKALEGAGIPVNCPILTRGGRFIDEFVLPVFDWLRQEHKEPRNEEEEAARRRAATVLWESVRPWITIDDAENVFWDALDEWLGEIEAQSNRAYNIRDLFYDLLDRCGVGVTPEDRSLAVALGITSQIMRSVEEIHRHRLNGHPRRTPRGVMSELYFTLRRRKDDFGESIPVEAGIDAVLVTTVHQAKGLEWPVVILPELSQGRFPVRSRGHRSSFPDEIAERYGTTLDDERRLFYVAVTRAKERLILIDPVANQPKKRSQFLKDLVQHAQLVPMALPAKTSSFWRIDPADLVRSEMPPIRIGLSDLLLYLECPFQFGLRRLVGIQPSVGDELGFGMGLHEVIQRRLTSGEQWTPDELWSAVESTVMLPYMSVEGEARSREIIRERIQTLEQLDVFDGEIQTEVRVEVPFPSGVVHGIIDAIQALPDGSVRIVDWKSNVESAFLPRYERQMQFYAYALNQKGTRVSGAAIIDVAASAKERRLVEHVVDINMNVLSSVADTFNDCLRGIRNNEYPPTPSPTACAACDVKRLCKRRFRA